MRLLISCHIHENDELSIAEKHRKLADGAQVSKKGASDLQKKKREEAADSKLTEEEPKASSAQVGGALFDPKHGLIDPKVLGKNVDRGAEGMSDGQAVAENMGLEDFPESLRLVFQNEQDTKEFYYQQLIDQKQQLQRITAALQLLEDFLNEVHYLERVKSGKEENILPLEQLAQIEENLPAKQEFLVQNMLIDENRELRQDVIQQCCVYRH